VDDGEKTPPSEQNLSAEEETFKKRYGDLRRHTQKIQEDFKKEIDDLRKQLDQAARKEMKLPKSEDDLKAWATNILTCIRLLKPLQSRKLKNKPPVLKNA
jgi:ABC-type transporter Mla subunit MlaD